MKKVLTVILAAVPALAALNVPLTIQEALYSSGQAGVNRTNEPFCMGAPIPDSAGITSTSTLGLAGASAGQFRITERWPSGNAKWVKVCGIVSSLTGGSTVALTLNNAGTGNFGGANIASGTNPITINTGAMTATIKDAGNFNVLDTVSVGSTQLVIPSSSAARGMIVTGPSNPGSYPANVTCGSGTGQSPCTALYSSANDAGSSCTVEETGPVMAVVRCIGTHKDGNGNPYMQFTVRETFYHNESYVKVTSILRNANYITSSSPSPDRGGSFDTAAKGMASYELRLGVNIAGTLNATIATNAGTQAVTMNQSGGTDQAYVYTGQSQLFSSFDCKFSSPCANAYTTDTGWTINKNTTTVASDSSGNTVPAGWADVANSSGAGVQIASWFMGGNFPQSLEFDAGGNDVRLGLFSARNSKAVYQAWGPWEIKDVWLNFHASSLSAPASSFLSFQAPLLGRAAVSSYNTALVFAQALPIPAWETNFYSSVQNAANPSIAYSLCSNPASACVTDNGQPSPYQGFFDWDRGSGGGYIQKESRLDALYLWLRYGYTGDYLDSWNMYRREAGIGWPHSDGTTGPSDSTVNGFLWSSMGSDTDPETEPSASSANSSLTPPAAGNAVWMNFDYNHAHWHGILDFYGMTGDETYKEATLAAKAFYLDNTPGRYAVQTPYNFTSERGTAILIQDAAKFSEFLRAIGDPQATGGAGIGVDYPAINAYTSLVRQDLCVADSAGHTYPAGCTPPAPGSDGGVGTSRVWGGYYIAGNSDTGVYCNNPSGSYRISQPFMQSLMVEALLQLQKTEGAGWTYYKEAGDLAYGIGQFIVYQAFHDDGTGHWYSTPNDGNPNFHGTNAHAVNNGMGYGYYLDVPGACPAGTAGQYLLSDGKTYDSLQIVFGTQTSAEPWRVLEDVNGALTSTELQRFKMYLQKGGDYDALPSNYDVGSYGPAAIIERLNNPTGLSLQNVPFTLTASGGGNYNLTFTPPAGSTALRIKYHTTRQIVDWLGYSNLTGTWVYDPATYAPWFAATPISDPAPTPGVQQTVSVSTGQTGLTSANFSVKIMAPTGAGSTSPGTPTTLSIVSGSGQTGTAGQALNSPFTVEVTDANGNPVSGVTVTFTVTAGGGSLSAVNIATNTSGLASSTLTLGSGAGTNTVTATAGTLAGSPVSFNATATGVTPAATTLSSISGNGQTGTAGQALSSPLTVQVTDANGLPVSGVMVTFTVTAGGGSLSAGSATTNTSGLASSTLTLGSSAGSNTVAAASGMLAGSPITFSATGVAAPAANITWTKQPSPATAPYFEGYLDLYYDPLNQETLVRATSAGSSTIYSNRQWGYKPATNQWSDLGGTGVSWNSCIPQMANMPNNAHPMEGMALDTTRNRWWLGVFVNASCNIGATQAFITGANAVWSTPTGSGYAWNTYWAGYSVLVGSSTTCTVASVTDMAHLTLDANSCSIPQGAQTLQLIDPNATNAMYYMDLTNHTWHRTNPAHMPNVLTGNWVYDPDDDVIMSWGYSNPATAWLYCFAVNSAIGCSRANDWNQVAFTGGPPGANYFIKLTWLPNVHRVLLFGGQNPTEAYNETWMYNVGAATWTQKCTGSCAPPPAWAGGSAPGTAVPAMAYIPSRGTVIFHQTSGSGAPQDWEYDPNRDTWSALISSGAGSHAGEDAYMTFDVASGMLVSWSSDGGGDGDPPEIWTAPVSSTPPSQPANMVLISGNGQTGSVGQPLTSPLTVQVTDAKGIPVPGVTVTFTVTAGAGSLNTVSAVTNSSGLASSTLTLGPAVGANSVTAAVAALPGVTFNVTAFSPCDLNRDGVVNSGDVQTAISQVLTAGSCGTADLIGNGQCTVIDVERVIMASMGGACKTGQ